MGFARTLFLWLGFASVASICSAAEPLETIQVEGSRAAVRKQVQTFVSQVTRKEGDLIGRWRDSVCPMVAGLSDAQDDFIRRRLIEVESQVRKRSPEFERKCAPNVFVIITDDTQYVLDDWQRADPRMFRWKAPPGVSRSESAGPVRIWHNAIEAPSDDGPLIRTDDGPPRGKLKDSRIQASAQENITAVVVLVDATRVGKVSLAQTADYVAMVSLSQIDLAADVGSVNTILKVFADSTTSSPPPALTDWDLAFLKALYRTSYSPLHQRMDLTSRMSRDLAPR